MRRAPLAAALVASALALATDVRQPLEPTIASAVAEGRGKKSVGRCVSYRQALDAEAESVDLRLANRCGFPVSCELSWQLSCDGTDSGREVTSFVLDRGAASSATASARSCSGDWEIADVRWSCEKAD